MVKDITRIFCESFLIFVISLNDMTNGGVQGPIDGYNSLAELTTPPPTSYINPKWVEPYFDAATPKNVTALVGKSAYLSCRVRNLGNKTVSWIRHRDIHILTVGAYTYTSDQRFQATYHKETETGHYKLNGPKNVTPGCTSAKFPPNRCGATLFG